MQSQTFQRSIDHKELDLLLKGVPIKGQYNLKYEPQSTGSIENAVCFFKNDENQSPLNWCDTRHIHTAIIQNSHKRQFQNGIGIYYVSKNTLKTNIWNGRKGTTRLEFEEAYFDTYSINDIITLKIDTKPFTTDEISLWVIPTLTKYGFTIQQNDKIIIATR